MRRLIQTARFPTQSELFMNCLKELTVLSAARLHSLPGTFFRSSLTLSAAAFMSMPLSLSMRLLESDSVNHRRAIGVRSPSVEPRDGDASVRGAGLSAFPVCWPVLPRSLVSIAQCDASEAEICLPGCSSESSFMPFV